MDFQVPADHYVCYSVMGSRRNTEEHRAETVSDQVHAVVLVNEMWRVSARRRPQQQLKVPPVLRCS